MLESAPSLNFLRPPIKKRKLEDEEDNTGTLSHQKNSEDERQHNHHYITICSCFTFLILAHFFWSTSNMLKKNSAVIWPFLKASV